MTEENSKFENVLNSRKSCRAFLPQALPQKSLNELFSLAQKAPSWCNIQPWQLTITSGEKTDEIRNAMVAESNRQKKAPEIPFPSNYAEPYKQRRKESGIALYKAMGIGREDTEKRKQAWTRNFAFFGAPHLVLVTRNKNLGEYATLDIGVWLGTLLWVAESMGIATCPLGSAASYPKIYRELLEIPETEVILLGIAIGRADLTASANQVRTTRESLAANLRYVGVNPTEANSK